MQKSDILTRLYSHHGGETRLAHWGVDFFQRENLQHWGGALILNYRSDEEKLHRGGRFQRYRADLTENGVRKFLPHRDIEPMINRVSEIGCGWNLVVPDQMIDPLEDSLETVWYFDDLDEGFRFALGV